MILKELSVPPQAGMPVPPMQVLPTCRETGKNACPTTDKNVGATGVTPQTIARGVAPDGRHDAAGEVCCRKDRCLLIHRLLRMLVISRGVSRAGGADFRHRRHAFRRERAVPDVAELGRVAVELELQRRLLRALLVLALEVVAGRADGVEAVLHVDAVEHYRD